MKIKVGVMGSADNVLDEGACVLHGEDPARLLAACMEAMRQEKR